MANKMDYEKALSLPDRCHLDGLVMAENGCIEATKAILAALAGSKNKSS